MGVSAGVFAAEEAEAGPTDPGVTTTGLATGMDEAADPETNDTAADLGATAGADEGATDTGVAVCRMAVMLALAATKDFANVCVG